MGWYIVAAIIGLIANALISARFASIAEEKGYDGTGYFFLCFFLGVVGYCMVAALPDYTLHNMVNALRKSNHDVEKAVHQVNTRNNNTASAIAHPKPSVGQWICKNCGTNNSVNYGQCKKCGSYKS